MFDVLKKGHWYTTNRTEVYQAAGDQKIEYQHFIMYYIIKNEEGNGVGSVAMTQENIIEVTPEGNPEYFV